MLNKLFPYSDRKILCLVISVLALAVYVVTAVANYGFHHADELFYGICQGYLCRSIIIIIIIVLQFRFLPGDFCLCIP